MTHDRALPPRTLEIPRPGSPPRPRVPRPERWTLASGLRVVAVPRAGLPQVAVRLVLPAGAVADAPGKAGTASLVGALISEGTHSLSADELNFRLDTLGASLSVQVGHDHAEVDLFLLSETLAEGLELLADLVVNPAFPDAQIERIRAETLDALEARRDEPANVADDRLALELFGPTHPYGRLATGTPDGVEAVDREALAEFHQRHFRPGGSVLLLAGDFDVARLAELLPRSFGGWEGTAEPLPFPPPPERPTAAGTRVDVAWPDAAQGEIRLGGLGMPRRSGEWIPAAVANYILGGSTITGRLGANLREEKGWTYGIRSGFVAAMQTGGWVIETAVDEAVVDAAVAEILRELERFITEPVPAEELRRAKDALILSLPRAFETPGRIVGRLGLVEAYGLPADYWESFPERVESVTADEVLRLGRRYFDPAVLVPVVVGPNRS